MAQDANRLFATFSRAGALRVKVNGDSYSYLLAHTNRSEDYKLLRKLVTAMRARAVPLTDYVFGQLIKFALEKDMDPQQGRPAEV